MMANSGNATCVKNVSRPNIFWRNINVCIQVKTLVLIVEEKHHTLVPNAAKPSHFSSRIINTCCIIMMKSLMCVITVAEHSKSYQHFTTTKEFTLEKNPFPAKHVESVSDSEFRIWYIEGFTLVLCRTNAQLVIKALDIKYLKGHINAKHNPQEQS